LVRPYTYLHGYLTLLFSYSPPAAGAKTGAGDAEGRARTQVLAPGDG
jgi:hypothetical protein